jgi:hypothetical protein
MTKSGAAARHAGERLDEVSGQQSPSPESSKSSHQEHGKAAPLFGEAALQAAFAEFRAKRIDANDRRLTAVEQQSGPYLRIIELVAPFSGEGEMREQVAALGLGA